MRAFSHILCTVRSDSFCKAAISATSPWSKWRDWTTTFDGVELLHPEDLNWAPEAISRVIRTGEPATLQYRVMHKDGSDEHERSSNGAPLFRAELAGGQQADARA